MNFVDAMLLYLFLGFGAMVGLMLLFKYLDKRAQQSPSGWEEITGLSLEERMMLDELAHGLVKPKSLRWICDMIRERKAK